MVAQAPTVYVVQDPGTRNISSASKYGDIKVLLPENRQIIYSSAPTVNRLRDGLKSYSDQDFLLLIGDPAAIGVATSIVSDINNGRYNLLKWDRQESMYIPIRINIKNFGNYQDE